MKLFRVIKTVAIIAIILLLAVTTFVFWKATPNMPDSSNDSGNIQIGANGTFVTSIVMNPINTPDSNECLVPEELEGQIQPEEGVNWVYEMKFEYKISWFYDDMLKLILGNQVFDGELTFTYSTAAENDLIKVVITKESDIITANDESVKVSATITMNLPKTEEEYNAIAGVEISSLIFTAQVKPKGVDTSGDSSVNFVPNGVEEKSVCEINYKIDNTKFLGKLVDQKTYNRFPVIIADNEVFNNALVKNTIEPEIY